MSITAFHIEIEPSINKKTNIPNVLSKKDIKSLFFNFLICIFAE